MKLSRRQNTDLVLLAREAWMMAVERGCQDDCEQFRHDHVAQAVGKNGLRCCENRHYPALMAHFLNYLGRVDEAFAWTQRAATDGRRNAEHKICEICKEKGLNITYAAKIARDTCKSALDDCPEKQLWHIYYTLKNRTK